MSTKKRFWVGSILILGLGLFISDAFGQADPTAAQNRIRTRERVRIMFVDENGDGINDMLRDHDNDGLPNCQDPDWTRPQDGSGYKNRFGNGNGGQNGGGHGWNNASFRGSQGQFGPGVCDGTGPKGKINRKGGR
jgi:hypothetical protein